MKVDPLALIQNYIDRFAGSTIEQIVLEACRSEIVELRSRISNIKEGFEGCCHACEPVGCLNQNLEDEIEVLNSTCEHLETDRNNLALSLEAMEAERDLARREVCRHRASNIKGKTEEQIAEALGWDCFKKGK